MMRFLSSVLLAAAMAVPHGDLQLAPHPKAQSYAECLQACLEQLVSNQEACYRTNCQSFLGLFRISCSEPGFSICMQLAKEVSQACKEECASASS